MSDDLLDAIQLAAEAQAEQDELRPSWTSRASRPTAPLKTAHRRSPT